ncbi:anthrone oxygenase family protein [Flavobacterium sp. LHD-85]|uniref:anthrone oxygenase family protein n=1 Tax=Flavobacterium sp. LHD-85 TaxID=3071410 RepID=UPI0027DFE74D|nr:anthrone oxygenase family protein [Flavobacterium sp. LHD-85]MDQ6530831.1 DUF1772 domain-containing protein [Flavobacterium sp. LHD-85]
MKLTDIILIITATFTALMAGLFFSYSISVMLGLGKLNDKEFLNAMQHINKEIQNPIFFTCFFGALIMLIITCFSRYNQSSFIYLIMAMLMYLLGVFLVTVFVNVPLNNKLEVFDISSSTEIMAKQMRNVFEKRWNFWNNIRTVSSILSLLFVILACIQENK